MVRNSPFILLAALVGIAAGNLGAATAQALDAPSRIKEGDAGIGRQMPDVEFTPLDGVKRHLSDFVQGAGVVVALTSTSCPVSKRYGATLAKLQNELHSKGIGLVLLNPFTSERAADIGEFVRQNAISVPYVCDTDKALAAALRATTTTEVLLLDSTLTLQYRGAIDDQFGLGYHLDAPRSRYLHDAVEALLVGQQPAIQATEAPGCELDLGEAKTPSAGSVTYYRDVMRILQQNCVRCHRDGGIAPFALDELPGVLDRSQTIRRVVEQRHMPPWFAATSARGVESPWANDCSLSERDRWDLLEWLSSAERPLGDPSQAPAPQQFPLEWTIAKPDLVLQLPRPIPVKAEGTMPYQVVILPTNLQEDRWVSAYEIIPTQRDVVHHVIVQVLEAGADARRGADSVDGFWAAYVPGNPGRTYSAGTARRLPKGAKLRFEIHYAPNGRAVEEQMKIGLVFAKTPPELEVKTFSVAKRDLKIPPNTANHIEVKEQRVPFDLNITALMAHMHIRGKSFKYEAIYADGRQEVLLDIPHYDFNWQLGYEYKQAKFIPAGSTMRITAGFDNSVSNKANPDPNKEVKWGPQTYDEMMIGYVEVASPVGEFRAKRAHASGEGYYWGWFLKKFQSVMR
jgi:mono/diheme cytochrome c family protein